MFVIVTGVNLEQQQLHHLSVLLNDHEKYYETVQRTLAELHLHQYSLLTF